MKKKIMQFRYYGDGHANNYPVNITSTNLSSGVIISQYCGKIFQLGIQTLPGVQFSVNNSKDMIMIGTTGIYELNVEGYTEINALNFSNNSLKAIAQEGTNGYLIIDIICEDVGV